MVKNKTLSDSARLCCTPHLVTLSLCLSLADAIHPEGTPGSCRGWTPAILYPDCLRLFLMSISCSRIIQDTTFIWLSCLHSLSWAMAVSQTFPVLMILTTVYRVSRSFGWSDIFLVVRLGLWVWGGRLQRISRFLSFPVKGACSQQDFSWTT